MTTCLVSTAVAGRCQKCGVYQRESMHLVDAKAYCADCCPEHNASHEWEESKPLNAEQMELL